MKLQISFILIIILTCQVAFALPNADDCNGKFNHKKPTRAQLEEVLDKHKAWLKNPNKGEQGNLCGARLIKVDFSGNRYLRKINFHGANLTKSNFRKADLSEADLHGAILNKSDLREAMLFKAELQGAELQKAKLSNAKLTYSNLEGVNFFKSNMARVNLSHAMAKNALLRSVDLNHAKLIEADFQGADFNKAILTNAKLVGTILEGSIFSNVVLTGIQYQAASPPAKNRISNLIGLSTVTFDEGKYSSLVILRKSLEEVGLRKYERETTYAIEHQKSEYKKASDNIFTKIEGWASYLFFDLTCKYGMNPGRIWMILGILILIFFFCYVLVLGWQRSISTEVLERKVAGIWITPPDDNIKLPVYIPDKYEDSEKSITWEVGKPKRLILSKFNIVKCGFFYSILSAFSIGWRDLNVGNWLERLQSREYVISSTGWVRTVSGIQALISIYLLALWFLVYFGQPF